MKHLICFLSLMVVSAALAEEPAVADKAPNINDPKILAEILEGAADDTKIQKRGKKGEELSYLPNTETPFTGWTKSMHDNGQVKSLARYENGKNHGFITSWFKNGQKEAELNYKNGILHGDATFWYENGQKKIEAPNVDGNKHGLMIMWYKNGQKETEVHFKNDEKHGAYTKWHENGEVNESGEYKNGVLISKNGMPIENLDTGKWEISEDSDPVTDKKIITAMLDAEEKVNITLDVRPTLIIRKKGSSFDAYVHVGTRVSPQNVLSDYMPIVLRMDKNKPVSRRWGMSNTKEAFFHPVPKLLANVLTETDTMLVRFQPYGYNEVTITFDVRGFDEAYKKF